MKLYFLKFIFLHIIIFFGFNNCYPVVNKDISVNYSTEIKTFNSENSTPEINIIQIEKLKEKNTGIILLIIAGIIQLALLTLQLTGLISISWLLVFLPAILSVLVVIGIFLFVALAFIIAAFQE